MKPENRISSRKTSRRKAVGATLGGLAFPAGTGFRFATAQESDSSYVQAVTTTHHQATEAGAEILRAGGTAADASVTIAVALSVVEPYFSHAFGGGLWALYHDAETGTVTSLDGVGPTGSKYTVEDYGSRVGQWGIHQSVVPGAWDAWMLWLREYGRLTLPEILAPGIALAEEGIAVSAEMAAYMSRSYDAMAAHPPTAATYAPNGLFPAAGDIIRFPDFAATLNEVGAAYSAANDHESGIQAARDYMYRGPIAEAIVAESDAGGGYLTLEDFAEFEAEIVDSISINYGTSMRIHQNPPNSQGITMLLALNTLTNFNHEGLSALSADTIHSQIEATKLAYGDRNAFIGDPNVLDIDVEYLLSDEHAAAQAERIDMNRAMQWPENTPVTQMEPQNTTTFHVTDQWGNAAAVTTSLGLNYFVVGSAGIHINNRMTYTSPDPEDPNFAEPGRKLRHTSCPYIVMRDDVPLLVGGNTGADSQPQVQVQQLMAAIDFGMTAQEAINNPRWIAKSWVPSVHPHQVANSVQLEAAFPQELVNELSNRGHIVEIGSINLGNGGMIKLADDRQSATVGAETRFTTASAEVLE